MNAYSSAMISDFNLELVSDLSYLHSTGSVKPVEKVYSYWYNPEMDYKIYMVPGISVILGFGLLFPVISDSQQQVIFVVFYAGFHFNKWHFHSN
ncbi:MAG: hypothetical protein R6U04_11020 [Bacteroidales bacterium]